MLRFYIEVARTAFRRQLIYRWANLAGLLTNAFFGSVFSYVIIALYHTRPVVAGYNVNDTLRYTWLVQAMIMVVLPFGWWDLMQTIRSGEVVADMSKPCDFYWYWFSREVGRDVYYLFFRCLPTYAFGMLLFGIGLTTEWRSWLAYSLALLLGAMIGIAYRFLYNVIAFWMIEARAVATLAGVIALFFTGSYVPLPFFPAGLRALAAWLPFNGLMNLPAELLVGKLTGGSVMFEIGRQVFWLVAITLLVRVVAARAGRRIISQGG
jgi:ABC-2 type transport system permease protein